MLSLKKFALHIEKKIQCRLKKNTKNTPPRVVVELTNRCNFNCPFCLVGQQNSQDSVAHADLKRQFGDIELSLVQKIVVDAKAFGMTEILLTFQGEPLLHPQVAEFIRISRKAGLKTIIFTNGYLLKPEFSRKLIRSGLNSILFSVDGASDDSYRQNRSGGKFNKVYQNMNDMSQLARDENSKINIIWQFIVLRNNEHEVETARKMADAIGVKFQPKTFAESVPELKAKNPQYQRKLLNKPCRDLVRAMWVYWNGDVVPCCYDLTGKEILGNVKNESLQEIWYNQRYTSFRNRIDEAVVHTNNEPELCKGCLKWRLPEKAA